LGQVKGEKALFFGNEHGVHALVDLDSDEPNVAWSFETQHSVWAQPLYLTIAAQGDGIALPQNRLFAGSLDKQLYSLDPDTGKEIWSTNLGGSIVAPPVYDAQRQRLYVGTLDSEVYAISLNGEKVGRYDTEGWVWGTPKLYQESIYFTDLKGWIYELALTPLNELNTDTDQAFSETWKLELTDESAALRASPTIYEPLDNPERPVLLVSGADKRVYALDLFDPDSPSILWNKELADVAYSEIVVVHEIEDEQTQELVVISTYDEDHLLVALRLDNGKEEWSHQYDD
jgi:outer membrane protein assembly factor BamB